MELVSFLTLESGLDLIVSFAIVDPDDGMTVDSLTIIRTPKYEFVLDEWERGASVTFDRGGCKEDGDLLRKVVYLREDRVVRLHTDRRQYKLDVRKVDAGQLLRMTDIFRKMNFDSSIILDGL
jgi:hypothetical protein